MRKAAGYEEFHCNVGHSVRDAPRASELFQALAALPSATQPRMQGFATATLQMTHLEGSTSMIRTGATTCRRTSEASTGLSTWLYKVSAPCSFAKLVRSVGEELNLECTSDASTVYCSREIGLSLRIVLSETRHMFSFGGSPYHGCSHDPLS